MMDCNFIKSNDKLVVNIKGEIYFENSEELKNLLLSNLQSDINVIVLNMEEVTYIDSIGIGILVAVHKNLLKRNGSLIIANLNDDLKEFFELIKLDKLFSIN